jgi:hypothetical protein
MAFTATNNFVTEARAAANQIVECRHASTWFQKLSVLRAMSLDAPCNKVAYDATVASS